MPKIVGIQFRNSGLVYYFKNNKYILEIGDLCVVKTSLGLDIGELVIPVQHIEEKELDTPLKSILRKANQSDLEKWENLQIEEGEAYNICLGKIQKYELDMHLIRCKYLFDKSRLIFYFCADDRVDFRELVKDLAHHFKTKIELKQVGVRDKAKMIGGLGICGRPLCCSTFISDFKPVPINVAKMQSVALNLSKVSGACGRLKCCLNFESNFYKEELKKYPKLGKRILTKDGKNGKVVEVNILSKYIVIETIEKEDNEHIRNRVKISVDDWQNDKEVSKGNNHAENKPSSQRNNRRTGKKPFKNNSRQ
ncbi:MAG: stage 0 sporulation family protein [Candidatus Caldatribacteriota bacterium]|jgi:cell fate regulator YaaT (PSP1 superfamily)